MTLEDDHIRIQNETVIKLELAELTIKWAHIVQEAVLRERYWIHGGPVFRKQAADLERQINELIFNNNLNPKPEVVDGDEVEQERGSTSI